MILCFELTMPRAASWNGKWSGEDEGHYLFKTSQSESIKKKFKELSGNSWTYSWSDGWMAQITARVVDASTARRLRARNKGFCGYDWMVNDILWHGEIQQR